MRPVVVAVGAAVAVAGASAFLELEEIRDTRDEEEGSLAVGYAYAVGFTLLGVGLVAFGLATT